MSFAELKRDLKYPAEYFVLLGLVIVLPLLEAPKNILWLAYVITWIVNRARDRDFGGAWDRWDSLIALWIASGYVVAAFAGLHHSEWKGANDILRYGAVLWLVKRSGYQRGALQWLLATIALSTIIAIAYAAWSYFVSHSRAHFELNSVGHSNHSSIYLAISYGALLASLLAFWKRLSAAARALAIIAAALMTGGIAFNASRAAVGMLLVITVALGCVWARRSRPLLALLAGIAIAAAASAYFTKLEVVQKQLRNVEENNVLSWRGEIWRTAVIGWRQFPLFGVGMDNFNQINAERIGQWREAQGDAAGVAAALPSAHAHSLYFNTLAERGLFGLGVLLAVLSTWGYQLLRALPQRDDEDLGWALWGASFSAWLVNVSVGFFNTTLHHEHALLSVLLLGMWLAYLRFARAGDAIRP